LVESRPGGSVLIAVRVPERGTVAAGDTSDSRLGTRFAGIPRLQLATARAGHGGMSVLTLRPTSEGYRELRAGGEVRVKVVVAYTPLGESNRQKRTSEVVLRAG
jgi:hypothetical protein